MLEENEIAKEVVDAAFKVHTKLGTGLLESVYESVLAHELQNRNRRVQRQVPVPVHYEGLQLEEGFRADILVDDAVILELKSVEHMTPVHPKQLLTYLRLTGMRPGLLINVGETRIKDGIQRIVNGLPDDPDYRR